MARSTKTGFRMAACPEADRLHADNPRSYAHTFHRSGVICVAGAFKDLPPWHAWAILAHEVGHLLAGEEGSEEDADRLAQDFFSITIRYLTTAHGQDLQTISKPDAMKVSQHPFMFHTSTGWLRN